MALDSASDGDLSRRCRRGDAEAWRELVRRFTPLVYRLSFRMLRDGAEAEDVSQEIFIRIHRSLDGYDPTRPLAPWVSRMTYHACLRRLQGAARRPGLTQTGDAPAEDPAEGPTPEESAEAGEAAALLARAVDGLAAQDRALLDLRYREGLSDSEVAEATGMPVNTVKTRIFRARATLRGWLGPLLSKEDA